MALTEDYLKSVSESDLKDRAFTPFELQKHDKDSIEDIKKMLKQKRYVEKTNIQESLDFVETLANRMSIAINNEKKDGKANWELESDLNDLKKVFDALEALLQGIDQKAVDDSAKQKATKKKGITIEHKK